MMVQDTLVPAGPGGPASATPAPPISCESQSCDELTAIASRGAHGGDIYFAAVKELDRRAHDVEVALEDEQVTAAARRREIIWTLAILVAAATAAGVAFWLGY